MPERPQTLRHPQYKLYFPLKGLMHKPSCISPFFIR